MKKLYFKIVLVIALMLITMILGCSSSKMFVSTPTNDFEEWAKSITQSISADERFEVTLKQEYSD